MAKKPTNFTFNNGGSQADFADAFVYINLFSDAGLWIVGRNNIGQLGDNTVASKSSPVQTVAGGTNWKLVAGGSYQTVAIKTDGTLWNWGNNANGQLGDNSVTVRSSPVQTVAGGTNWKLVTSGRFHTAAIKTDGTLWLWGRNGDGQLGANNTTHRSSPVQTVAGGTNWKLVAGGDFHTAAVKTDGTLWTWGINTNGQLGDNTVVHRSSPVQTVSGGTNWKLVAVGHYYTTSIKTDGTLWNWGNNGIGQLGDDSRTHRSSPVQTVSGGTNWKLVECGHYHTTAIKTDGTLWLWGGNAFGQLGDNSITYRSSPIQTVAGGTNWKQVAGGLRHTAAVKTDGTLWTWGLNNHGQLGDNTVAAKSSPIQTVSGGTNWKLVTSGRYHTAALSSIT
jgi:alpha-tubulin suppressor-like RCC1 family protein